MRVVAKLTAAMLVGICAVLIGHAWIRVQREARLIEDDIAVRHVQVGHALALAIEAASRLGAEVGVSALLADAAAAPGAPTIRWLPSDAVGGRAAPTHAILDDGGDGRLETTVPLSDPPGGALVLSEPLTREREYLRATIVGEILTALLLAAVCAALTLAVGTWLVGRPTGALAAAARRIGDGQFDQPLRLRQRDELGALAAALNAAAAQLAAATRRAAEATEQRVAALEHLRHADRLATVGTLAAGIAHELGTPLMVVAEHARQLARGAPDDAGRAAGAVVLEQAGRMTTIIRQVLDFARRRTPRRAVHELPPLVDDTLALLAPLAKRRGIHLRRAPGETLPPVAFDPAQIQQALTNLVVNGLQAAPPGGLVEVAIDVAAAVPPPDHDGGTGPFVRLVVSDDGAGIADEHRARVFEPFFTTKSVGDGTGLGLSVAHGIVRDHGGWIAVERAPSGGARVIIHLPAAGAPLPANGGQP